MGEIFSPSTPLGEISIVVTLAPFLYKFWISEMNLLSPDWWKIFHCVCNREEKHLIFCLYMVLLTMKMIHSIRVLYVTH